MYFITTSGTFQTPSKVRKVTDEFLAAHQNYNDLQKEADSYKAQIDKVLRKYTAANEEEKGKFRVQFQALQKSYNDSQQKANTYQLQVNNFQKDQELAKSDHSALVKRIQDLQGQLVEVT